MQPSTRKFHTYVLPMPAGAKSSTPSRTSSSAPRSRPTGNLWHSSPLEPKKHEKDSGDDKISGPTMSEAQSVLKESNSNYAAIRKSAPPLAEGLSLPQLETLNTSETKKGKRQAYSGPLTSKPWSTKPILTSSGPIASTELPQLVSGLLSRVPVPQPSSPKISPGTSPPVSSPRINELHELPRPPVSSASKPARFPGLVGHSAPLISRNELSATNKTPSIASNAASPLPTPPTVPRSFSIPSSSQRATTLHVNKLLESTHDPDKAEEVTSPPLTPISLPNIKPTSTISEVAFQSSNQR